LIVIDNFLANKFNLYFAPSSIFTAIKKIRESDKTTECIMITRITDKDTVAKAKELGVRDYLLKPLANEDWLEKVHAVAESI